MRMLAFSAVILSVTFRSQSKVKTASIWVLALACIAALLGGVRTAEGAAYTFTNITDSTGSLIFSNFLCPSINDEGTVVFTTTDLITREAGVYVVRNGVLSLPERCINPARQAAILRASR